MSSPQFLKSSFSNAKQAIRRVARVGENGGLWAYTISYLSSLFMLDMPGFPEGTGSHKIIIIIVMLE